VTCEINYALRALKKKGMVSGAASVLNHVLGNINDFGNSCGKLKFKAEELLK
jgi:hypothetical protein